MNLDEQDWEQSNIGRLQQLLKETEQWPNRGFEWYYWQRQLHLPLKTLAHSGPVTAAAFSPHGARIVTSSEDGVNWLRKLQRSCGGKKALLAVSQSASVTGRFR